MVDTLRALDLLVRVPMHASTGVQSLSKWLHILKDKDQRYKFMVMHGMLWAMKLSGEIPFEKRV